MDREQEQRHHADDDTPEEERQVEEDLQCDRAADDFGEVGGDGDDLGLPPVRESASLAEAITEQTRQRLPGDESELRGQVLDENGDEVRGHEHPDEEVPVLRTGGEIGRDVARIDIRDGRDEGRAEEHCRGDLLPAVLLPPALAGAHR